jgi:hypothetical protein
MSETIFRVAVVTRWRAGRVLCLHHKADKVELSFGSISFLSSSIDTTKMGSQESTIPIGNALTVWTTLFLLWSSFFFAVRVWAKWQQHWSSADAVFVVAYVWAVKGSFGKTRADTLQHRLLYWRSVLPYT